MFDSEKPDVYEKVYEGLVERLSGADLAANAAALGLAWEGGAARVALLGRGFEVSARGVRRADGGEVAVSQRIVLAYYLLHGGRGEPSGCFVPYRELPGGQDFARNLATTVEGRIAKAFGGRLPALRSAAAALGGAPADTGTSCDAAFAFDALPRLPLLLTFYDEDEDFPAEAKLFYDSAAPTFLDLECLAVLGMILAARLERADG